MGAVRRVELADAPYADPSMGWVGVPQLLGHKVRQRRGLRERVLHGLHGAFAVLPPALARVDGVPPTVLRLSFRDRVMRELGKGHMPRLDVVAAQLAGN